MANMKDVVLQIRYPYAAGIIAVVWVGLALIALLKPDVNLELIVGLAAVTSTIIALVGFSAPKR